MRVVDDLYRELREKYGGRIPFKTICADEGIIAVKTKLSDGVNGFYVRSNGHRLIVLNSNLTHAERRDWAFHELFHHFKSGDSKSQTEENRADLFAALCRIDSVKHGDDIESICERYGVSAKLAKIRIQYEIKKQF